MTPNEKSTEPIAVVTGGSRGLGRALVRALVGRGWHVITDGRNPTALREVADELGDAVTTVVGDVADDEHRGRVLAEVDALGRLDLLVNNASTVGASPLPPIAALGADVLTETFAVNVVAPAALVRLLLPHLRAAEHGTVLNVTSDAAVEAYPTWGAYGASKAALEHLSRILAEEESAIDVLVVDPGDMRTDMHQAAFPGEDISDRPLPEASVPGILALLDDRATGRHRIEPPAGEEAAVEEVAAP